MQSEDLNCLDWATQGEAGSQGQGHLKHLSSQADGSTHTGIHSAVTDSFIQKPLCGSIAVAQKAKRGVSSNMGNNMSVGYKDMVLVVLV